MKIRPPMNPVLQNGLIMIASGLVASVLCAKVYGATLPAEEPTASAPTTVAAPAPRTNEDAAAAAQLRAMLSGRTLLVGTQPRPEPTR